LSLFGL